jgi:hypothetical protein
MNTIIIISIILHNISFLKLIIVGPKKIIKWTILLKQIYYMYYNTIPKSAQKQVTIVCFHLSHLLEHVFHKDV